MGAIYDASGRRNNSQLQLNYDKVLNNPATKVIITTGSTGISAVMTGDFSFGIGSEYTSLFDTSEIDNLSGIANRVTAIANAFSGKNIPQLRFKTPGLTSKVFQGNKSPVFSVDLLFANIHEDDNIMNNIKILSKMCMPTIVGGEAIKNAVNKLNIFGADVNLAGVGVYAAPLGYNATVKSNRSSGPVTVKIGSWFNAPNQIVEDVAISFSKIASDAKGTPMYCTVSVKFCPSIDIEWAEFLSYLNMKP